MIYIPDSELDRFLLEDVMFGDLTSRSLGLNSQEGEIRYISRRDTVASGVSVVARILQKLGLNIHHSVKDGQRIAAQEEMISARGYAEALHQGWKVSQNILEWCCGVAQATSSMLDIARKSNAGIQIACTRKSIPGARLLASQAVLDGGGILHRCGTAETILVFANHRRFLPQPFDWEKHIAALKLRAPEKKIIVEADSLDEALCAISAHPDIVQLDKFLPVQIEKCLKFAEEVEYHGLFAAAGGIHSDNVHEYAATGIPLLVTSSPYYAKPADIHVLMHPD